MATLKLGYDIYSDAAGATFSAGTWVLPLSNLQDPRPSKKARSSGLSTANTKFRLDLGAARSVSLIAITHTNLTSAALYRITWYSDAFVTAAGNSGWLSIPGYPSDDPDAIGAAVFHLMATTSMRYLQAELDDASNPDGYIEIGRVIVPAVYQPSYNFDENSNGDELEPNTPRQNALGGTGYFNRRTPARAFRFQFGVLPDSEAPTLRRIRKICNLNKQVIVIPDPDDTSNFNDRCFLATLRKLPGVSLFNASLLSTGFEAVEVV